MERPGTGGGFMTSADTLASGKGAGDENFPVASWILKPQHRAPVMAFYHFARVADDVADHESAMPAEKLRLLGEMRSGIGGEVTSSKEAAKLAAVLASHKLDPQHALDLLTAFERDVTKTRYADWDELLEYCRYSAMPVGRYVLDVHGEDRATWAASDALCAALQIINHLQDCAKDFRALDRVYIPADTGVEIADLDSLSGTPRLRTIIVDLATRTEALLAQSSGFAMMIKDHRLALEVAIIHRLAVSLTQRLKRFDPLSERVHHTKLETFGLAAMAVLGQVGRLIR